MVMTRQRAFSGTLWEDRAGYCRAMRIGNQILVSGTSPSDGQGGTYAPGNAYAQTKRCFEIIESALQALGGELSDVVRTRLYVTDMARWEEFAQAHQELFGDYPPVNTMVEVAGLINPDMLVEVEAEALCEASPPSSGTTLSRRGVYQRPLATYQTPSTYPPTGAGELDEGCLD